MNYNSVILVGVVALTSFWWFVHAMKNYKGPEGVALPAEERRLSVI